MDYCSFVDLGHGSECCCISYCLIQLHLVHEFLISIPVKFVVPIDDSFACCLFSFHLESVATSNGLQC